MLCLSVCALFQDASAARAPAQRPRALTPRAHTRAHAHTRTHAHRYARDAARRPGRHVMSSETTCTERIKNMLDGAITLPL